jgi:hypothetical protein
VATSINQTMTSMLASKEMCRHAKRAHRKKSKVVSTVMPTPQIQNTSTTTEQGHKKLTLLLTNGTSYFSEEMNFYLCST